MRKLPPEIRNVQLQAYTYFRGGGCQCCFPYWDYEGVTAEDLASWYEDIQRSKSREADLLVDALVNDNGCLTVYQGDEEAWISVSSLVEAILENQDRLWKWLKEGVYEDRKA